MDSNMFRETFQTITESNATGYNTGRKSMAYQMMKQMIGFEQTPDLQALTKLCKDELYSKGPNDEPL